MSVQHVDWENKYELGVEDIDLQHHYFLNLINRIAQEIGRSRDDLYLNALVSELNAYAKFHFISEETMMVHADYPRYQEHRRHHLDLIQRLSIEEYNLLNRQSDERVEETLNFLTEWFLEHTNKEDRQFAEFLMHSKE